MRGPQPALSSTPGRWVNGSSLLAEVCVAQGHVAGTVEHARAAAKLQPWNAASPKKILRLQTEPANRPLRKGQVLGRNTVFPVLLDHRPAGTIVAPIASFRDPSQ